MHYCLKQKNWELKCFISLQKICQEEFEQYLPSHHITYGASIFSMPWWTWTVIFLSKFGSASIFCTLYFKVVKYLSMSLVWSFMLASLPLGLYHFFVTVTLLIDVHKFACSKFLCMQSFITFKGSRVKIPGSSILCTIHLYSVWIQLAVTLDCFLHS